MKKEEVLSTRKGYEEQMIVLTEHMTGQNERIAKLDEEMGLLLGNKVLCTKCKVKEIHICLIVIEMEHPKMVDH